MRLLLILAVIYVTVSLCFSSAAQKTLNSCDMYTHPQYGTGRCIEQSQCHNGLYLPGLCESHPSNIQCCFAKTDPELEEFRAVWIATVENIDWPSTKTASPAQQQTELVSILDTVQRLNMNAVVFQVNAARSLFELVSRDMFLHCRFVQQVTLSMLLS